MNLTTEHLADILIGIARSQNALIDALERISPGFHNMHAMPLLNIAANTRVAEPRMIDFPARILLRLQGRVALENAAVKADLERLMSGAPAAAAPAALPGRIQAGSRLQREALRHFWEPVTVCDRFCLSLRNPSAPPRTPV